MKQLHLITRLESYLDAKFEEAHLRRFETLVAKIANAEGKIDPASGRTRLDAISGSMHSFPYMLWTVRRQIWHEKAFHHEVAFFVVGMLLGIPRGFGPMQWLLLVMFGVSAFFAEANNTASEMKFRHVQHKFLGGVTLDIDIGDMFEFAALPVAMFVWPWGLMWVIFMIAPG